MLEYWCYFLADKLSRYDEEVLGNIATLTKTLRTQINWPVVELFEPISIVSFLPSFKLK